MKITVAIPTISGRSKYLASCLKTCVSQDDDDLEIIVSDNPGSDACDVVASLNDKRIRYIRPSQYLPMAAHWDFVVSQLSGEFFTIIGDDDGLMPGCIGRVRKILRQVGITPIQHSLCNYYWPDYVDPKKRNRVDFFHPIGVNSSLVDSRSFLAGVAHGTQRYADGPMVYHNFAPTAMVRGLVDNGVFFRRSAPDVYSSIALAANIGGFFSTEELLTISGQGAKSNGAAYVVGNGAEFFEEMMSLYRPRFPGRTIQMMLLDSLFEVADHFKRPDLLSNIKLVDHFMKAMRESKSNGANIGSPELWNILAAAIRHGVGSGLIFKLASSLVFKAMPAELAAERTHVFEAGDVLQLGAEATDIYEASLAVAKAVAGSRTEDLVATSSVPR